jgi:hypothetical protein
MKTSRKFISLAATGALALAALGMSGAAQARDHVAWSIGIGVPGVALGVGNAPVYYQQPVYQQPIYAPQPTVYYSQPPVIYQQPPVVYAPAPYYRTVYVAPPVIYRGWGGPHYHGHRGWDRHR